MFEDPQTHYFYLEKEKPPQQWKESISIYKKGGKTNCYQLHETFYKTFFSAHMQTKLLGIISGHFNKSNQV
jgi:hypothetical protein